MEKLEELNYHVDFGPYYVHLTRKQKKYLAVRSVIDRILAVLALVLLSPLFLAVSIAQKVSAPDEPIFFLQKRVGKGAHCFNIIKFRTMKSSAFRWRSLKNLRVIRSRCVLRVGGKRTLNKHPLGGWVLRMGESSFLTKLLVKL
jgi:lipopolysaccharide/colanic/teichoic acid biosynthesis glycosyltransferase